MGDGRWAMGDEGALGEKRSRFSPSVVFQRELMRNF